MRTRESLAGILKTVKSEAAVRERTIVIKIFIKILQKFTTFIKILINIVKMPDSCCAVQCRNMRGKCDENIKFYRFPIMKNQQTTETRKK